MYLQKGVQKVLHGVREHPSLFLLLVLLQITFIASVAYITIQYQVQILNTTQDIIVPLQNANYDAQSIEQGQEFMTQVAGIYRSYQSLIHQVVLLALWWLVLFMVLNGGIWVISQAILAPEKITWKKMIVKPWLRYVIATLILLGPFLLILYFILKMMIRAQIDPQKFGAWVTYLLYSFGILYYFLINAFAAINATSLKELGRNFLKTALRKIHWTLIVLIINSTLLAACGYLIYYFMEIKPVFALMMAASIVFIILVVITRLYWIACLQELIHQRSPSHEKSHS